MRSFEIFVAPPTSAVRLDSFDAPRSELEAPVAESPRARRAPAEVLDLFVEGANVTARVAERHGALVLRDLATAALALAESPRGKRLVRFYDDALELCLERSGESALLSLYRTAPEPSVHVLDRPVRFRDVLASTHEAASAVAVRRAGTPLGDELARLAARLDEAGETLPPSLEPLAEGAQVVVELDPDAQLSFGTEVTFRPSPVSPVEARVERADVHALLFRGRLRAEVRGRSLDLGTVFPFFFAERVCALVGQALLAAEKGQALYTRVEAGGALVGLRLGEDERLALVVGTAQSGPGERTVYTFPNLRLSELAEAALAFGRGLVRGLLRRDRSQAGNLRVGALRRQLRETSDQLRAARLEDAKINLEPEPYRAFADRPRSEGKAAVTLGGSPRLRYAPRWRALVPGIDLRSTFLCGERLLVGAQAETFCLHRETGEVLWRIPTSKATHVATPSGLVRVQADGTVAVHDLGSGEVTLRTWIAPQLGAPPAGAVVHAAGLPRMFVVTEGDKHVAALDLSSGEARWRYAVGRHGALRMKRHGRLLYLAGGDRALTALDVVTGGVVWRAHDRRRFHGGFAVDRQHLAAVSGGAGGPLVLRTFDPYSGEARWSAEVGTGTKGGLSPDGAPYLLEHTVVLAARERRGVRLYGFDRETGELAFDTSGPVAPVGTSWLAVDGRLVGNAPTGDVFAVDGATGALAWHRPLGPVLESDAPRRLEPVLRGGALFVPYTDVAVVRPTDGALLGTVGPCEAIPDLLRVDERGDVYVAEESGHLAAFGVGARLRLVT